MRFNFRLAGRGGLPKSPNRLSGRDAPLYHATHWSHLASILSDNRLIGRSVPNTSEGDAFQRPGVSLTRDRALAERFNGGDTVVLVIDQAKLIHNHKIIPRDYYGEQPYEDGVYQRRSEREEFVPGDINDLRRYLLGIIVPPSTLKVLDYTVDVWGASKLKRLIECLEACLDVGVVEGAEGEVEALLGKAKGLLGQKGSAVK